MSAVHRVAVPGRAIELARLTRMDYADCFVTDVSGDRPPEEWIRLVVAAKPALFAAVRAAHRALGLRLAPADSTTHVIGWDVERSDSHEAVLTNSGLLGQARIIGIASPTQVQLITAVELNGTVGRAAWAVAAPVHRAVARYALGALAELPDRSASLRSAR